MYTPEKFRVDDLSEMHEFMRTYRFATLISVHDSRPEVSHIPVYLDNTAGQYGKLRGHFARANPHCQKMAESPLTLVIFHGPHEYISPSWYEQKPLNVPTWNYMAVHAHGSARVVDETELKDFLIQLVTQNESGRERPWELVFSDEMLSNMLPSIVGFEISLTSLEGKYKISQNRNSKDQMNVAQQLGEMQTPSAKAMSEKIKIFLGVK